MARQLLPRLAGQPARTFALARSVPAGPDALFAPINAQLRLERIQAVLREGDVPGNAPSEKEQPCIRSVLVDAAGTLIAPSEPAAAVYLRYAAPYGCTLDEAQILANFRRAFNMPWTASALRYDGEACAFWRRIVAESTGCDHDAMHDAVYQYFARSSAWTVAPGAVDALKQLRAAGFKLAVVSNFDTRLRPILEQLGLLQLFDAVIISAEVGAEKPNPAIFEAACSALRVPPGQTLVLGDDRRNDVTGGRDAGCSAWLFGVDVADFQEASRRLLAGQIF